MKKRILLFFTILIAMTAAYFLYQFYQDDYLPEKIRGHYESEQSKSLKSFSKNEPKKRFVPRKEFHEDTEYKRSDDQVVTIESLPPGELSMLRGEIQKLEMMNLDCEKNYNSDMPPNQIIDPVNSQYFQNIDNLLLDVKRGMTVYNENKARTQAVEFVKEAEYALASYNEVSAQDFAKILRAPLVCRQSNLTILFESVIELAENGELSDAQKEDIVRFMANAIIDSTLKDRLQDNILMNLTLLKGVGLLSGMDQSFYTELEGIYDDLREDYSSIYDKPESDKQTIVNPSQVYGDYLLRQQRSAQRVQDLIYAYLDRYLE